MRATFVLFFVLLIIGLSLGMAPQHKPNDKKCKYWDKVNHHRKLHKHNQELLEKFEKELKQFEGRCKKFKKDCKKAVHFQRKVRQYKDHCAQSLKEMKHWEMKCKKPQHPTKHHPKKPHPPEKDCSACSPTSSGSCPATMCAVNCTNGPIILAVIDAAGISHNLVIPCC